MTLHPVIIHYRCGDYDDIIIESSVFVSCDLSHNAHFVNHVTEIVLDHLKTVRCFSKVVIVSDGCGFQYKSKIPFYYLRKMSHDSDTPIERFFFGSNSNSNNFIIPQEIHMWVTPWEESL